MTQHPLPNGWLSFSRNFKHLSNLESLGMSREECRLLFFGSDCSPMSRLTDLSIYHFQGERHVLSLCDLNHMFRLVPNLIRLRLDKFTCTGASQEIQWPRKLKHLDLRMFSVPGMIFNLPTGLETLSMHLCTPCYLNDASLLQRAVVSLGYRFEVSFKTTLTTAFESGTLKLLAINRLRNSEYRQLTEAQPNGKLIKDRHWIQNYFSECFFVMTYRFHKAKIRMPLYSE